MATTTTYVDSTFSASVIGARTDSDGSAVTDLSAEEARFPAALYSEGAMTADSFKVTAQTSPAMSVKVGSGVAKSDYYCVSGDVAGQGNYIVRLDVTSQNITISAADAAQDRIDQIWLVVLDNVYDVSSKSLPRLAYRKGEIGGAAPGADSTWKAAVLLATIPIAASSTTVTNAIISDQRTLSGSGGAGGGSLAVAAAEASVQTFYESTSSTTYTNLATVGPTVTLDVGAAGIAIVNLRFVSDNATFGTAPAGYASFTATGANAVSAADARSVSDLISETVDIRTGPTLSGTFVLTGLVAGSTTFTMKYRTPSSWDPLEFSWRTLSVVTF